MPSALARKLFVLVQHALDVGAVEDADEAATVLVAAVPGDEKAADLAQTLDDFGEELVRSLCGRAELHAVLCRGFGFSLPAIAAESAEHYPALVDDDAYVMPCRPHAITNVAEAFARAAGRDVLAGDVDRAAAAGGAAFERKSVDGPVGLPAGVVVHAGEA